jgi:hypothetical protein
VSDLTPTPHLDDDRLSAIIDGEATPEDEQHVGACPECGEKLAVWRQTLSELDAPVPVVDVARREAAIDAALAGGGVALAAEPGEAVGLGRAVGSGGTADAADRGAPVSLADRRRRRGGPVGSRVAAAVAAVIVIAGVGLGLWQTGGGGSDRPTAAPAAAPTPVSSVPSTIPPGEGANGIVPTSGESSALPVTPGASLTLGAYKDPGPLVATLRKQMVQPETAFVSPSSKAPPGPSAASSAASVCSGQAASDARLPATTQPVVTGTLTYRGSPALVYVFEKGSGHTAAVVSAPECRLLALASF